MPSRTTTKAGTKADTTKAGSTKTISSKASDTKTAASATSPSGGKRKANGASLASAAAAAGRRRSVKAAQTEQRTAAPLPAAGPAVTDPSERDRMVAEAAYYRAQNRNFAPGHELDDWLDAEAEIERYAPAR